jgi:2-hydroxychromene-2-carboxylate isomerase
LVYHTKRIVQFNEQKDWRRMPQVTFYFDLGSPYAYLAAERLQRLLPEPVVWQPVLLGGLFKFAGRSSCTTHVLDGAAEVGLHHSAVLDAVPDPRIKQALREATERAYELGVIGVPTIAIDDELFWGDDRLEDAAARLRTSTASRAPGRIRASRV